MQLTLKLKYAILGGIFAVIGMLIVSTLTLSLNAQDSTSSQQRNLKMMGADKDRQEIELEKWVQMMTEKQVEYQKNDVLMPVEFQEVCIQRLQKFKGGRGSTRELLELAQTYNIVRKWDVLDF